MSRLWHLPDCCSFASKMLSDRKRRLGSSTRLPPPPQPPSSLSLPPYASMGPLPAFAKVPYHQPKIVGKLVSATCAAAIAGAATCSVRGLYKLPCQAQARMGQPKTIRICLRERRNDSAAPAHRSDVGKRLGAASLYERIPTSQSINTTLMVIDACTSSNAASEEAR